MIIHESILETEILEIIESLEDFMELTKETMKVTVVKNGKSFEIHARQDIKYFERIAGFVAGYVQGKISSEEIA